MCFCFNKGNCSYVDCIPGAWSDWSKDCGYATRNRAINSVVKTIEQYSCSGLLQTCPESVEEEDRSTNCMFFEIVFFFSDILLPYKGRNYPGRYFGEFKDSAKSIDNS